MQPHQFDIYQTSDFMNKMHGNHNKSKEYMHTARDGENLALSGCNVCVCVCVCITACVKTN